MQHIFTTIQRTLKKKAYDRVMIGRLLLNELWSLLGTDQVLQWYLKWSTLSVILQDHDLALKLFRDQQSLIHTLNIKLADRWYDLVLRTIRTTPRRDSLDQEV